MKNRLTKSALLVGLLVVFSFSSFATILSPVLGMGKASAASSSNYIFSLGFGTDDQERLKDFKDALKSNDEGNGIFDGTTVYTKGGVFDNKALALKFDQGRTSCAQAGTGPLSKTCQVFSGDHFGGPDETLYVYTGEYYCRNGKTIDGPTDKAYYKINFSVALNLAGNNGAFDGDTLQDDTRLHWVGFGSTQTPGATFYGDEKDSTVREEKDINVDRIPKGCLPDDIPSGVHESKHKDTELNNKGIVNWTVGILEKASAATKKAWQQAGATPGSTNANGNSSGGGNNTEDVDIGCTYFANPLTWVICPVIDGFEAMVNGLDKVITSQLSVGSPGNSDNPSQIFCDKSSSDLKQCDAYHSAWVSFRNIALGLLLIIGLAVIISEMAGFEFIDAYTLKKMLPRIVVAALALTLSWQLMDFFIQLSNAVGYGVRYLIYQPFVNAGFSQAIIGGGGQAALIFLGLIAGGALGVFGLLSFAATGALAVLVAFLTLMIRELVIIALVIIAPVAIILYIMPNTERYYKMWWEMFFKALLMFPMIMALIASGRVFAAMVTHGSENDPFNQILGFAAYFAPYFMIPMTFKFSGAAMSAIGGAIDNNGLTNFGRKGLQNFRSSQYQSHGGRRIEALNRSVLKKRAGVNNSLMGRASSLRGYKLDADGNVMRDANGEAIRRGRASRAAGWAIGKSAAQTAGHNLEAVQSAKQAEVAKELNDQIATGRDEEIRGLLIDKSTATEANGRMRVGDQGQRQFKSLTGAWVDEAHVDAGQSRWGNDSFAKQAALSYEIRKADKVENVDELKKNYWDAATSKTGLVGGKMSADDARGAWLGATFENAGQHLELKYTDPDTGNLRGAGFVSEIFEKKGSYPVAQMHPSTIKALRKAYDEGDDDTKRKVSSIAKTFVSSMGGGVSNVDDDGKPIMAPVGGRASTPMTNTPGAAHVAEEVNALAHYVGVLNPDTSPMDDHGANPPHPPIPPQ